MTIYLNPNITNSHIAEMAAFDAFRQTEELLESRDNRDAVRVLCRVIDAEPGNSATWELSGRAPFPAAQITPAEDAFRRLIELEPTSVWAHAELGVSLDSEGATSHQMAAAMGTDARADDRAHFANDSHPHRHGDDDRAAGMS